MFYLNRTSTRLLSFNEQLTFQSQSKNNSVPSFPNGKLQSKEKMDL
jgi:hypothetical protein